MLDLPSETRIWKPEQSGTLMGTFHLLSGLNWAVRTEDGSVWLLEAAAENQLESLDPIEGQAVQVFFIRDGWGRPDYHVSLPERSEEDEDGSRIGGGSMTYPMSEHLGLG